MAQPALHKDPRHTIANSLFSGVQIGASTLGRLASLATFAYAIKDLAANGKLEKDSFDSLFEIESLARRLTMSTVNVAKDTYNHTFESTRRLVAKSAE
jgi:hypothetical protein